jgi:hypothetical protein
MPDGYTLGWKLLDAVSTPNLESFARCFTGGRHDYCDKRIKGTSPTRYGINVPRLSFENNLNEGGSHE